MTIHRILIAHGDIAGAYRDAVSRISGAAPGFDTLSVDWREGCDAVTERLRARLAALPAADPVLLLADLFGATPSNAARRVLEPGRVVLVAGVNLPLLVRLVCGAHDPGWSVGETARWLQKKGRDAIVTAEEPEPGACSPAPGDPPAGGEELP